MVRGTMFKLGALLGIMTIAGQIAARAEDAPFSDNILMLLGQPSVYRVVTSGTLVVNLPGSIEVNLGALQAAHDDLQTRNQLPADLTKAQAYCALIASDPARFLRLSSERVSLSFPGAGGAGSAFAISREGILLTNAHVVNIGLEDLAQAPKLLAKTLSDPPATIARQLDERVTDELQLRTNLAILEGLANRQLITAEARDLKIQLFGKVPAFPKPELRLGGLVPSREVEQGIPARLIAKGHGYPGRDVAVLRTARTPANLGVKDPYFLDKDRLICLRLGDSADVLAGTRIRSFGFPGAAFDPNIMAGEAERLVSSQLGEIGQIKPLRGEMPTIFEMSVEINHGYSGGPVIDTYGRVIGLNVAIHPVKGDQALHVAGHTLAVPISVALPFLKAAGIDKLDPGPLSEYWERGLRLFAAQDYAGAEKEFADLLQLETSGGALEGNPYVRQLQFLCQKKQGKVNLPAAN
jgi:S1-C subfamily serine protease